MRYHKPKRLSHHGPMTAGYAFLISLMIGGAAVLWYFGGTDSLYHLSNQISPSLAPSPKVELYSSPNPATSETLSCDQLDCPSGFVCRADLSPIRCHLSNIDIAEPELVTQYAQEELDRLSACNPSDTSCLSLSQYTASELEQLLLQMVGSDSAIARDE